MNYVERALEENIKIQQKLGVLDYSNLLEIGLIDVEMNGGSNFK